jgi:hypothetical protein
MELRPQLSMRLLLLLCFTLSLRAADEPPGAELYRRHCATCHESGGPRIPPTSALRLMPAGTMDVLQKRPAGDRAIPLLAGMDCSAFQSEGFLDELNLPKDIPFGQPPHLAFPDHVQNLVALNRAPRSIERSKTLAGIHPPLDRSMVLFHNIV